MEHGAVWVAYQPDLPAGDVETLRDVKLQTPMRVYTREGDLIGQDDQVPEDG